MRGGGAADVIGAVCMFVYGRRGTGVGVCEGAPVEQNDQVELLHYAFSDFLTRNYIAS